MFAKVKQFISEKITNPLQNVPFTERSHIGKLIVYGNYHRLQYLLFVVLVISIALLISDFILIEHWQKSTLFKPFIIADVFLFAFILSGIVFIYKNKIPSYTFQRNLIGLYLIAGSVWLGYISGLDYQQNYLTYIIGVFLLSGFFILDNKSHSTLLAILYGIFISVNSYETQNHDNFSEFFLIPISTFIAWLFGRNLFNNKVESLQKQYILESYTNNLEEIINLRTKELEEKNHSLIKEIESKEILHNQLLSSQELFKRLLHQSADSIAIFTLDGEILQWNRKSVEYSGIAEPQAMGKNYWNLIAFPENLKLENIQLKRKIKHFTNELSIIDTEPKPLKIRHWIVSENGEKRFLETKLFPIVMPKRKLIGAISRNITQQMQYETHLNVAREKAEQANKDKTDFLANVSHDLRSPLNSISGFSQILEMKPNLTKEKQNRYLKIIYENSQYLLQLINSLIDLSKLQSGGIRIEKEVFYVDDFLQKLNSIVSSEKQLQSPNVTIVKNCEKNNISIETDYTKLLQIFTNLINNAIKFTKKGTINFGCKIKENTLHCFVEDTGIGMSPEELSKIFERFYSSEVHINKTGKGIGLAIVKGYIDLLGGEITVESQRAKGTRFDFSIPIEIKKQIAHINENIVLPEGKNIMIIDQNPETTEFLIELLTNYKLHPLPVNTYEKHTKQHPTTPPDLILIDIIYDNNDNIEILKKFKTKNSTIPVIGYTAQSRTDFNSDILGLLNVIVYKPINVPVLLQKLMQYLA